MNNRNAFLALLLVLAFYSLIAGVIPSYAQNETNTTATGTTAQQLVFKIDGGELGGGYGLAFEGQSLATPGPGIIVNVGDTVTITFKNVGKAPHTLAIVSEPKTGSDILFGAQIGSAAKPMPPGQEQTITFTVDRAGNFYYGCTLPGHMELGMHGDFIVQEAVGAKPAEAPAQLMLGGGLFAIAGLVASILLAYRERPSETALVKLPKPVGRIRPGEILGYVVISGVILAITTLQLSVYASPPTALPQTDLILGLAVIQAALVALFYMHLRKEPRSVWGLLVICFLAVAAFVIAAIVTSRSLTIHQHQYIGLLKEDVTQRILRRLQA